MPSAPRRPAIAGAAQYVQRLDDPRKALEPVEMMERALRDAAEDAGAPKLLEALDAIYTPQGLWRYGDPGRLLAQRVGAGKVETSIGVVSGHIVQVLIDRACAEIAAGRRDVVAIVGGESEHSKRRLKKTDPDAIWNDEVPGEPDLRVGDREMSMLREEFPFGMTKASACFALCETSLRAARGVSPAEHRRDIAALAARMSAIAAENPNAWIRRAVPADEIATPTPGNRMVTYPYTKLMTANIAVDQSAALIVCSEEAAERYAVPQSKRVYLRGAAEMNHGVPLSARQRLHEHPGMRIAGERALALAGATPESLRHIDFYSCFPFALQAGAAALGIDPARALSVTGGMTFSGGPFGNYVIQSAARMMELLRRDAGSFGLVGALGGSFSKFAFGVYSTDPGESDAPAIADVSEAYEALPKRAYSFDHEGDVTVESYCVDVLRSGPHLATFTTLGPEGQRVWARSDDRAVMDAILDDEDFCGRRARVSDQRIALA